MLIQVTDTSISRSRTSREQPLTALLNGTTGQLATIDLTAQNVTSFRMVLGHCNRIWHQQPASRCSRLGLPDDQLRNGQFAYPAGTYTVWAESLLNNMKDNYQNAGADYTGKTVSQTYTVTLVSDTVKIEANKDSVVRSKPFSVTITGKPNTLYHLWVKGTSTMSGGYDDQPP